MKKMKKSNSGGHSAHQTCVTTVNVWRIVAPLSFLNGEYEARKQHAPSLHVWPDSARDSNHQTSQSRSTRSNQHRVVCGFAGFILNKTVQSYNYTEGFTIESYTTPHHTAPHHTPRCSFSTPVAGRLPPTATHLWDFNQISFPSLIGFRSEMGKQRL